MRHGFVRACAATPEIKVGDTKFNAESIAAAAAEAEDKGAQLIVFPELCTCGYTCGDLFNQSVLIDKVEEALGYLKDELSGSALVFVGAPLKKDGKLYNCAVALCGGKILGVVPKTYLPAYGEFYERRHFCAAEKFNSVITVCAEEVPFGTDIIFRALNMPEFSVSCELCEDLWVPESPSVRHVKAGAQIIVNLSCSDEIAGKAEYRRNLVKMQSSKLICGYVYTDAGDGESTTDMVFAGHNVICEYGQILAQSKLFENGLTFGEIDVEKLDGERARCASSFSADGSREHLIVNFIARDVEDDVNRSFSRQPFVPRDGAKLNERTDLILSLQTMGLVKRLKHTNARTAVIGVSGGLDSALALLVTCRAFKRTGRDLKDIIAVSMPGFGTTDKTYQSTVGLTKALGVSFRRIDVKKSVLQHFKDIAHDPENMDITYENAQARMRTLILMDMANDTGGLVIGTGDLSESALGWATYNGDHMSMYAVNASVPKTLVKHLIRYEAESLGGKAKKTLEIILDTDISPELLPPDEKGNIAQRTEDIIGPYELHDFFLYYSIRWGFRPEKVRFLAKKAFDGVYDIKVIDKWLKCFYRRFFSQQFKRSCIPDGVKVGTVTLSPRSDWRMPSDASAALWLEDLE